MAKSKIKNAVDLKNFNALKKEKTKLQKQLNKVKKEKVTLEKNLWKRKMDELKLSICYGAIDRFGLKSERAKITFPRGADITDAMMENAEKKLSNLLSETMNKKIAKKIKQEKKAAEKSAIEKVNQSQETDGITILDSNMDNVTELKDLNKTSRPFYITDELKASIGKTVCDYIDQLRESKKKLHRKLGYYSTCRLKQSIYQYALEKVGITLLELENLDVNKKNINEEQLAECKAQVLEAIQRDIAVIARKYIVAKLQEEIDVMTPKQAENNVKNTMNDVEETEKVQEVTKEVKEAKVFNYWINTINYNQIRDYKRSQDNEMIDIQFD